jgi:hypothetical protein
MTLVSKKIPMEFVLVMNFRLDVAFGSGIPNENHDGIKFFFSAEFFVGARQSK